MVRKLFPQEDFWLASDEIDASEVSFQTGATNISGVEHVLGIRAKDKEAASPGRERTEARREQLARRVVTMLTAFNASVRTARHKADLVACWASMSNIRYPYDKDDTVEEAMLKVVPAIREQTGLKVLNFFVTNDAKPLTVDSRFMRMAAQQYQSTINNQSTRAPLPGAPAFTGRVDSVQHMLESMLSSYQVFLPSAEETARIPTRWRGLPCMPSCQ